eukprot:3638591-Rhodomonas_salina.3
MCALFVLGHADVRACAGSPAAPPPWSRVCSVLPAAHQDASAPNTERTKGETQASGTWDVAGHAIRFVVDARADGPPPVSARQHPSHTTTGATTPEGN